MTTIPDDLVYLDYNATTPLDPRVLDAMLPAMRDHFGNAASRHHALGCDAATRVEAARARIAEVLGADPREIVFTSGATEANNLAIHGVAASPVHTRDRDHVVTVATEHRAVLDPCEVLAPRGVRVTVLPVDSEGRLDLDRVADAITDRTLLVSVMHANNETGLLHPIETLGALCRERGALFHTDATQSFAKEPIDVESMSIDLLSASAHKICGPKGVGFLFVRRKRPRVRCEPLIHGGGHERGVRSGTLNVPGILGLAEAAALAHAARDTERTRVAALRDRLHRGLASALGERLAINGALEPRLANTLNASFRGVDGEALMKRVPDLAVSSASACTSALIQPSHVLGAMGCDDDRIRGSIRFSAGRFTTEAEIDRAVERVTSAIESLEGEAHGQNDESCAT